MLKWNDLRKLIYCKRLLKGPAKAYVEYEVKPFEYSILKLSLLEEFKPKVTSATVHRQLKERKKNKNETLEEYLYEMMNIGAQASVEEQSIIHYTIAGIPDSEVGKLTLYGATSIKEFKQKLKIYENFKENSFNQRAKNHQSKEEKSKFQNNDKNEKAKTRHCYNCGDSSHAFYECPNKSNGPKCFRCNKFGHRSKECENIPTTSKTFTMNSNALTDKKKTYCQVLISDFEIEALVDTGSDITLIKESEFLKLNLRCRLNSPGFTITGLGSEVKTKGFFICNLKINKVNFLDLAIYVIEDNVMRPNMVIGMNVLNLAEILITKNDIKIKKLNDTTDSTNRECDDETGLDFINSFDSLIVDTIDFPDTTHIKNKEIEYKINNVITSYSPNKTSNSPIDMKIIITDEIPFINHHVGYLIKKNYLWKNKLQSGLKMELFKPVFQIMQAL